MKIKVNTEFLSLDLLFIFSLKKSTGNFHGLIRLSNNSVSRAIMYKERKPGAKQIMSKSLESIKYLHLHDDLPPDFPVEIRKYQIFEKFICSISAKQNKWSIDYDIFRIRDLDVTKICTSRRQVSESKLPLMTTDEILQNVSKVENIRHLTGIST